MSKMVLMVLNDTELLQQVLDAWEKCGVLGTTVFPSSGRERLRGIALRDDVPLFPSLSNLYEPEEEHHFTLFALVDDSLNEEQLMDASEAVVGDFSDPHTGIIWVMPVSKVRGLTKKRASSAR